MTPEAKKSIENTINFIKSIHALDNTDDKIIRSFLGIVYTQGKFDGFEEFEVTFRESIKNRGKL